MTTPVIGQDCDITLTHKDVNAGAPYSFILATDPTVRGGAVSIQRNTDPDTGEILIRVFCTILLADNLKNPDGSKHSANRSTMYGFLIQYLSKIDGLSIDTVMGVFTGVAPTGFAATEMHQPLVSHVACQFTNLRTYHPPITSTNFFLSIWNGTLTWATSYWR
jgi:hypothetical protein